MSSLFGTRAIELNELPKYSQWIPYLLGLNHLSRSLDKSIESIAREYGQDKWGTLLQSLKLLENPTIKDADMFGIEEKEIAYYANERLYVADSKEVQTAYFSLITKELQPLTQKSDHLVELGAGYGSIILKLASLPGFDALSYTAGEYTDTGVACMKLLASNTRRFQSGLCDLNNLNLEEFTIPENAIFMTSWTMACLKGFSRATLDEIIRYKPSVVIHIEPIYEYWSDDSLFHMLWQSYCRLNDYNQSLLTTLKTYESEGIIQIIEEKKNVFGSNPLAPVSIIKWVPCGI